MNAAKNVKESQDLIGKNTQIGPYNHMMRNNNY